ncbi:MAG: glycyl radical protein [Clostridia bacterium]|nr:glycyl radical protein [Clostridia bacterium]
MSQIKFVIKKSPRIDRLVAHLFAKMPEIEPYRAELVTESYKETENLPIIKRRSAAFRHILENIPVIIRPDELIVGSNSVAPRGCQTFPEFSFEWLPPEYETIATREADPFYISDDTIRRLEAVHPYWKGKTVSDLAASNMDPEVLDVFKNHGIFTVGNYFYNGIGHITVNYEKVIKYGYESIIEEAKGELSKLSRGDGDYADRRNFLEAVIESCEAVINYAHRYSELAQKQAFECTDPVRKAELQAIAANCERVPAKGARSFYEACQAFWFVQQLLQMESSGHSISPGRFDVYMYPFFKADLDAGKITYEQTQEILDCIWVKLNDLNKVRDAASAEGFAGYGLFQNLIVGGQDAFGCDTTNDLSYMCMEAQMHVRLPQPSLSIRVWNRTPHSLLLKAASVTRKGLGVPAYYNDEVIIPSMMSRGHTLEDARTYSIIGCVEPQACGKTDGWHDAAFFNMVRPIELVFSSGIDKGMQIGPKTPDVLQMTSFEEFYNAYKTQQEFMIEMMVQADNSVDAAHRERTPLPFESCMVEDCLAKGKSIQEGGAHYNFTGPQGFGIANVADSLAVVRKLVFEDKTVSMAELKQALEDNFGKGYIPKKATELTIEAVKILAQQGIDVNDSHIQSFYHNFISASTVSDDKKKRYDEILRLIESVPKYGNDIEQVDMFAREIGQTYTKPLLKHTNPRGGIFQAGLYPVSANVPLGYDTGATPDGRLSNMPVADGVGPMAGRDTCGPTATANSVARLDLGDASNGTLLNQKFHPSALAGEEGLEKFVAYLRGFFDQKGMHVQYNVVSRETLLDAQAHPENYKTLVVRVAGYSALFTTLSRSLQDDIISRTEQTSAQ